MEKLNQPGQLSSLVQALQVLLTASQPQITHLQLDGPVAVHNPQVALWLRPSYTAAQFAKLWHNCQKHGVFQVRVHPQTGLIATSGGEENPDMAARQWVTDSIRCGELERPQAPQGWRQALQTLAGFYTGPQEKAAFLKAIQDPQSYRQGGPEEGVAHIFFPSTLQRDPAWFNNKRLESHGLALQAFCQSILARTEPWGLKDPPPAVLESIVLLANYFLALDYPTAPSAGNWEETPFDGGLTWDTQAIRGGLEALLQLLSSKHPELAPIQARLLQLPGAERLTPTALRQAIAAGQDRLRRTYLAESPGHREMDSSLVFLSQTDLQLDDDPLESARRHLQLLSQVERALVREHGMLRYAPFQLQLRDGKVVLSPDSYLTLNYNVALDREGRLNLEWKRILEEFGSKDASDPQVFAARAGLSTPDCEAEWFMVSDLAHGYAHQAENLLNIPGPEARQMEQKAFQAATRNLNRAYARITSPQGSRKANGEMAPGWAVPEAYQQVSSLLDHPRHQALAGVNTPLTWASASLDAASRAYLKLLQHKESEGQGRK